MDGQITQMVGTRVIAKQVSVPTTAAPVVAGRGITSRFGFTFKAPAGNSGTVYLGNTDVDTSTGYPLAAGESVTIAIENLSDIYMVASAGSQNLKYSGVG